MISLFFPENLRRALAEVGSRGPEIRQEQHLGQGRPEEASDDLHDRELHPGPGEAGEVQQAVKRHGEDLQYRQGAGIQGQEQDALAGAGADRSHGQFKVGFIYCGYS